MIRVEKPALLDDLRTEKGVVQASAGTGKTYLLERIVVDLVLKGMKLEEILVVTFTDKATLELKARIRAMLEKMAALPEDFQEEAEHAWTIGAEGMAALRTALRSFERATISTIHGFCRRVLQESAFEGGSLLRQELADGRSLLGRAWREVVRRDLDDPSLGGFLQELLGSGWTFDGLEDLLWKAHGERGTLLPEPRGDPVQVLAAYPPGWEGRWPELEVAVQALGIHPKTREAFLKRLETFFALMAEGPSAFRLCTDWDFHYLEDKKILESGGAGQELWEWMEAFHQASGTPEAWIVHRLLPPVRRRLRELKDAEGLYDHDDSILQVQAALEGPRGEDLAARLRERYHAALIDEFQDTDQAQWSIFKRCFGEPGRLLYVIGDPKQAIYGFRGGDLPTYRHAARTLLGGAAPLELRENHRSTAAVIEAYNQVFTGGSYDPKTGDPVTAFFSDRDLYPAGSVVQCGNPRLLAETGDGRTPAAVRVLRFGTLDGGRILWRKVARILAREIKELVCTTGVRFGDPEAEEPEKQVRTLHYGDVQVLVEKHRQGREMAEALRAEGIPFSYFKQDGLLDSPEAMDLLDCLGAVLEPRNRTSLARALVTPFFGYGWQDLEALRSLGEDHRAVLRLREWQTLGRQRQFPRLFEAMLHQSGLIQRLRLGSAGERSLTNFLHLTELLMRYARDHSADLEDLVRLMKRWMDGTELPPGENGSIQRLEGERRAVQILTLHQSKGLEAPIVALYGFTKPNLQSKVKLFHRGAERCAWLGDPTAAVGEQFEVERAAEAERLFYVALTRARAMLVLPCFVVDKTVKKVIKPSHPAGNYRIVNRRLRELAEAGGRPDLFEVVAVSAARLQEEEPGTAVDLGGWTAPVPPSPGARDYQAVRTAARPRLTTSYTALHDFLKDRKPRPDADGLVLDGEQESPAPASPDELPRGSRTGVMLHKLLEQVDLQSAEGVSFEAWWADAARKTWVGALLERFGLWAGHAPQAARVVYDAIRVPLDGAPLSRHDHAIRELGFLALYLDTEDLFQGAMDVIFERAGRIHLLDWKSDSLSDFGPGGLDARVRSDYLIQVKIYLNVVLAYFGIRDEEAYERRFAALHYVFLRGLPEQGVWTWRPAWADVLTWRRDLEQLREKVIHV